MQQQKHMKSNHSVLSWCACRVKGAGLPPLTGQCPINGCHACLQPKPLYRVSGTKRDANQGPHWPFACPHQLVQAATLHSRVSHVEIASGVQHPAWQTTNLGQPRVTPRIHRANQHRRCTANSSVRTFTNAMPRLRRRQCSRMSRAQGGPSESASWLTQHKIRILGCDDRVAAGVELLASLQNSVGLRGLRPLKGRRSGRPRRRSELAHE